MRCALFFDDSTNRIQAAWYDPDAAASVSLSFSALRGKLRAASEKECLVFVGNPNRRLREAGERHGFKEVLFLDPVAAAIREWRTVSEGAASVSRCVVVLDCDSDARMRWELRGLDPDSQVFVVPADDENGTTRGGFVPAVCGAFDVGLERFVDWFQHQECNDVILTGSGIENVGLTDELSLLFHWTVFRCERASVLGAARPPVASKHRVCDEWIIAAEAALHHGRFDMAISALKEAVAVFDVPPGAVEALGVRIREALLSAGDAAAPDSAPAYFQKALKVPLPDTLSEDEKDKIHASIYERLARCYCRSGDYGTALESALAMDFLVPDVSDDIFRFIEEHRRKAFNGE